MNCTTVASAVAAGTRTLLRTKTEKEVVHALGRGDACSVRRDPNTLRRWAAAVEHDAHNALDGIWSLAVDDSYVLTVRRDGLREQVLLDDMVDEDSWPPDAWAPKHRKITLDLEAAEAVADELLEVLRLRDVSWPSCSQHDQPVSHCSAEWICSGSPVHQVALFGALQPPNTA